jgi:cell division protein FtsW
MTGLIPLTGVPMPLISYGGSSMVFSLMGMGILASISRETEAT